MAIDLRYLFSCVILAVAIAGAWNSKASAQRVLLLGSATVDAPVDESVRAALRSQLREHGADVVSPDTVRTLVDQRFSREPVPVGADEVGELASAVRELEALVATRQREAALRQAEYVRVLSEGTVDALAEQRELARTLMNGCLADAWLHLQLDENDAARDRLRACRELHPDVAVDMHTTAPVVAHLLTAIDAELASLERRTLRIDAPAGCDVLLNGRHFGTTPQPLADVPIGHYQVELACPDFGHHRVHSLVVADEDPSLAIDPAFDDALRSPADAEVGLVFPNAEAERASHVEFALRIAVVAGATEAFVLTPDHGATRADRVSLGRGVIASVLVEHMGDTIEGVATLLDGRSADLRGIGSRPYAPWSGGPASATEGEPASLARAARDASTSSADSMLAGVIVVAVGALGLAGGWASFGLWSDYRAQRSAIDPTYARWNLIHYNIEQTEWAGSFLGAGGALLIAGSIPLWLPDDGVDDVGRVPWWSWAIGAAGAIAIGVGAGLASVNGQTMRSPDVATCHCYISQSTLFLGSLLWDVGGAALALPITHLLRVAFGTRDGAARAPSVLGSLGPSGGSISLGGAW